MLFDNQVSVCAVQKLSVIIRCATTAGRAQTGRGPSDTTQPTAAAVLPHTSADSSCPDAMSVKKPGVFSMLKESIRP
jgi:hypothetical protein